MAFTFLRSSPVITAVVSAKIWNTDWGQLSGAAAQF